MICERTPVCQHLMMTVEMAVEVAADIPVLMADFSCLQLFQVSFEALPGASLVMQAISLDFVFL